MSTVDTTAAARFLQRYPATLHGKLVRMMTKIGLDLTGYVQINKLQGQALNHRTGWLSSHVHPETTDNGSSVTTTVGVDSRAVPYAAIHEYGFHGPEHVKAHTRIMTMCFGRPVTPTAVSVGAFTRTMNMPERSYLRSSLKERIEVYMGWLRGVTHAAE